MDAPRWLADEMLGRLARYLRFMGHDTEYARSRSDREIAEQAAREGRVLLTRDRGLAARVPGALLLKSPVLDEQLRAVRAAFPDHDYHVALTRCTLCNGTLEPAPARPLEPVPEGVPTGGRAAGGAVLRCRACGHLYWEGSHTAGVRRTLDRVFGSP